jgi:hypothetical protein
MYNVVNSVPPRHNVDHTDLPMYLWQNENLMVTEMRYTAFVQRVSSGWSINCSDISHGILKERKEMV